jgi:cell division protein FtsW
MPLLIMAAIASVAVRLVGEEVNGAYRWIQLGGLSFQAAELIKFALIVWLAGFLSDRNRQGTLESPKTLKTLLMALGIIGFVVVVLQSDLGSGAVMVAIMGAMAFIAGLPLKKVMIAVAIIMVGLTIAIGSSSYRRERVQTFLQPTADCEGTGYQSCQALIAVGSGGVFGLGLGQSVQAYGYLPEAGNDSIFAIYAEKFGYVGSVILLGLLFALFARIMKVLERAPDEYSKLLVTGVLAWLSTQAIINIGAMLGLLPLKGITLPLISYGGTSLIFVTAAIGVVFSVSRYTTYGQQTNKESNTYEDSTRRRGERRAYHAPVSRRP